MTNKYALLYNKYSDFADAANAKKLYNITVE